MEWSDGHSRPRHGDRCPGAQAGAQEGIGLTDAIRDAVRNELDREEMKLSLWERTAEIRVRIASYPDTGFKADKAFYDSLHEED